MESRKQCYNHLLEICQKHPRLCCLFYSQLVPKKTACVEMSVNLHQNALNILHLVQIHCKCVKDKLRMIDLIIFNILSLFESESESRECITAAIRIHYKCVCRLKQRCDV